MIVETLTVWYQEDLHYLAEEVPWHGGLASGLHFLPHRAPPI